jgi:RimJ/RimL family protein N-acetyltransferase
MLPGMDVRPVTLRGEHVRLEPLSLGHVEALAAVGCEPEIWKWIPTQVADAAGMRAYVERALAMQAAGEALPFATVEQASGRVVGSTRYMEIQLAHRRLEIGYTWIAPAWQRTRINTEAKLLMLGHAFEVLGCNRVELKTDALNTKSRTAIERLGAKHEGIFRKHVITQTGRIRDTAWYSILDTEWPEVKARLRGLL